jgi:short-subunit dehydrogenase
VTTRQKILITGASAGLGAQMARDLTTYAASKAGVAALAEGIRADLLRTPIRVTTLYPGYIVSEMSSRSGRTPLMVSTEKGVRAMVRAGEAERAEAKAPAWPWVPLGFAIRHLPLRLVTRMS